MKNLNILQGEKISDNIELLFPYGFTERDQQEAKDRGYLSHVFVKINGAQFYNLTFYDYVRLGQDLEEETKNSGDSFIADTGIVILPEIRLDNIKNAVMTLEKKGFFKHFISIDTSSIQASQRL